MTDDTNRNLQTTSYEEWEEIVREVKRIDRDITGLIDTLNSIPKTVWIDDLQKAEKAMGELKSALDDRVLEEHPEQADTDVFYGPGE